MLIKVKFAPRVLVPKEAIDSGWCKGPSAEGYRFTTADGKNVIATVKGIYDLKEGVTEYFKWRVKRVYNMDYNRFYNLWKDRFSRLDNIWYEFDLEKVK